MMLSATMIVLQQNFTVISGQFSLQGKVVDFLKRLVFKCQFIRTTGH
jgi:hypothetical protein